MKDKACSLLTDTPVDPLLRRRSMPVYVCFFAWLFVSLFIAVSPSYAISEHVSFVEISGFPAFSGETPVRLGGVLESFSLLSYLALGEHDSSLSPLFVFTFQAPWHPQPQPETIAFLERSGKSPEDISLFFILDYELQLMQMLPQEAVLEAMLAGRMPDLQEAEAALPSEVVADLWRLQAAKDEQYLSYEADLVVLAQDLQGRVRRSVGYGVVQYRTSALLEEHDLDAEVLQMGAIFDGQFWGTFAGAAGEGELHGNFLAVPFELDAPWVEASVKSRWGPDQEQGTSTLEEHWERFYPISGFRIGVPQSMDKLDHELTIELLLPDGRWSRVYQAALGAGFAADPGHDAGESSSGMDFGLGELFWNQRHIDIVLPKIVTAGAARFRLHGAPFAGEYWELLVRSGPMQVEDAVWEREWRYFHGW